MKNVYITIAVFSVLIVCYFIFAPSPKPETIYVKGKDSVITKSDTIINYIPKYFETTKIISDTVHITHFNQDSSIVKDTVINNLDTAIVQITTYPAIDSIKYNLDLRLSEKLTTVIDSVWITRVDTLKITEDTSVWYDNFIFGALTTAIVTILVIFGLQ